MPYQQSPVLGSSYVFFYTFYFKYCKLITFIKINKFIIEYLRVTLA